MITSIEDAQIGLVTNAVVFKITDKQLFVEFFNNVKAIVPMREVRYGFTHINTRLVLKPAQRGTRSALGRFLCGQGR